MWSGWSERYALPTRSPATASLSPSLPLNERHADHEVGARGTSTTLSSTRRLNDRIFAFC